MTEPNALTGDAVRQQQAHERSIESIANETHAELAQVRELFNAEVSRLSSTARIKTFVAVIATRMVRESLTQTSHSAMQ